MKSVLISGASSGIGKATKEYFVNNGYFVIAIDINKPPPRRCGHRR